MTIISAPGTTLRNVKITTDNPASELEKKGIIIPVGIVDFKLEGLTPGAATTVNLLLPQDHNYNSFWKYGKTLNNNTDHWYEFLLVKLALNSLIPTMMEKLTK